MTRTLGSALLASLVVWQFPAAGSASSGRGAGGQQLVERQAYLMGTSVRLVAYDARREAGLNRLEGALRALEDTEQELSTWRADSDISVLNRTPVGTPWRASARLCRMFTDVLEWQQASGGAFDPAVGVLVGVWNIHEGGRIPSPSEVAFALGHAGSRWLDFDPLACTLTRRTEVTIDVGAFGKGEALDRAAVVLGDGAWMIDLGGQVSVNGRLPDGQSWTVEIADPVDRQRAVATLQLQSGSLSTSGGSERDMRVEGRRVGHILDPRTGLPASFNGSVSVWHQSGLVADMLSTALYVMGPDQGVRWATAQGVEAAFLIPDNGGVRIVGTPAFTRRLQPARAATAGAATFRESNEPE